MKRFNFQFLETEMCFKGFIRFLKEYKIYSLFMLRLKVEKPCMTYQMSNYTRDTWFEEIGNGKIEPQRFFSSAFSWAKTIEGDVFWRKYYTVWSREWLGYARDNDFIQMCGTIRVDNRIIQIKNKLNDYLKVQKDVNYPT